MKIVNQIPNTITLMNLLCGTVGVIYAMNGRPDIAFYLMIAGAVFDFCDGFAARLLGANSELGKQLDSLSDLVTFGVLPSIMLHQTMIQAGITPEWLCYSPVIIAAFSAFRLAKFNIDERQSENFLGLATPACAMICGSFAYYVHTVENSVLSTWVATVWFIPVCALILSLLLISEIPMFSMKFKKNMKGGTPIHRMRISFVAVVVVATLLVILLGLNWSMIVLLVFTSYIVMNVGNYLIFRRKSI